MSGSELISAERARQVAINGEAWNDGTMWPEDFRKIMKLRKRLYG